jgi:predicted branched-subunit amino acid permease
VTSDLQQKVLPPGRWFLKGLRDGIGMPALLLMTTMCGIGGLVRDIGFPVWAGTLSTLAIWAGPAQVILFGAIAAGASLPATAFAIGLSSARFLPMTVSILPLVRRGGAGVGSTLLAAHLVSMTTWVEGLRRLPQVPLEGRMPYFLGYGAMIVGAGAAMTHAGFYLYALLPTFLVAGFLFTTPLFFSSAMLASARTIADWVALGIGFFLTPFVAPLLPAGFDFLIIGVLGGSLAFAILKRTRAGRAA